MCEPTTIGLLISAASVASGVAVQSAQASAQNRSNDVQFHNTLQARADNANQITLERSQQADSASQKINANNTAQREAQSSAVAGAGAQGISGLSVDSLIADQGRKGATYDQSVNENLARVNMALDNQLTNVNRGAASDINSLHTPAPVDYLGAALKIGSAAYGQYTKSAPDGTPSSVRNTNYGNEGRNYQSYTVGGNYG